MSNEEKITKIGINWDSGIYRQLYSNHWKISTFEN